VRAALCSAYGPPETIQVTEVPAPSLAAGEARVSISAASVNFPDVLIVSNDYQLTVPPPFTPGSEFAGVVTEVAPDVREVAVGDPVIGTVLVGAFAEEIAVAASVLTRIPVGIDMRSAAAFGVAHRTAYHVLRSVARVKPGDELIVLGAGGGVGLAAVQLGVQLGASVTAVASTPEKLEVAKSQGATTLIDHKAQDLRQALRKALPEGADVVLDPVGGQLSEPALRSLHWGGRFVTVGYAAGEIPRIPLNLVLLKGIVILGFQFRDFATHSPEAMRQGEAELLELLATQRIAPHIGASFTLDETAAALRYVADGRAIGKVVLDITP
jgi:NADPH:quinone reductase